MNSKQFSKEELSSNQLNDPLAQKYGLTFSDSYAQYLKFELLSRFSKKNDRCLDVGIANGIFSIPLSKSVSEVHGIDISEVMLKECQMNIDRLGIQNVFPHFQNAAQIQFPSESFDMVYSYSTLLLMSDPWVAIKEMCRVLKKNGTIIIDLFGKYNFSRFYWARYYKKFGHFGLSAFALSEIRNKLAELGLEIVEIHSLGFLSQFRLIKGIHKLKFLEKVIHYRKTEPDLDYHISNQFSCLASRWYIVGKKID
jgi:ubiquinone/menaquinone biosynthesis C-methylase UbiE